MTIARRGLKIKVKGQGQCKMFVLHDYVGYCGVLQALTGILRVWA